MSEILIDQARIDAPDFPRDLAWWQRFVPMWVTVTERAGGIVALDVAAPDHPSQTPGRVSRRKQHAALVQWVSRLPRISAAVVHAAALPS